MKNAQQIMAADVLLNTDFEGPLARKGSLANIERTGKGCRQC